MNEREKMMHHVCMHSLAVFDVGLFLDSHPHNQKALQYYHEQQKMLQEAVRAYQEKFGPLTHNDVTNQKMWNWIDGPWPWEGENE